MNKPGKSAGDIGNVTLLGHYSGGRKAKREIFAGIASVARILGSGKRSGVPP